MEFHKVLGLSSFSLTMLLLYLVFAHTKRWLKWFTAALYLCGRVVPLPLPFKFAFASLCCQNLIVYEPFVDMLWGIAFMYRCVPVK